MAKNRKKDRKGKRRDRNFDPDKLDRRIKKGQKSTGRSFIGILKRDKEYPLVGKLKDGSHVMDIIPYKAGKNDPDSQKGDPTYTFEYWGHPKVGSNNIMVLCPKDMYDDPCPICEDRQRLREDNAKESKWKPLFPKRRNLYNVKLYDKGEAEKGVQILDISYHYMEKYLMAISEKTSRKTGKKKIINFVHPNRGKSIAFKVEPAKGKNDYPEYVGHRFEDREDYKIDQDILDDAFCLDECVLIMDYDEIKEIYFHEKGNGKGGEIDKEALLEELEDLDDMDELEDFIDDHDLDIKIRKKDDEDDVKEKIEKAIEDIEEEEGEEGEEEITVKDIRKMKTKKLIRLIEDKNLDIDPDDFDDDEDLQDEIIEEMDLDED